MNKVVFNDCHGGFDVSSKAVEWMIEHGLEDKYYRKRSRYKYEVKYNIPRHHPLLVKVVETLGKEANGSCAELRVAEIEGNMYRIDEYDGWESVDLPSDIEWVTI